MSSGYSNTPLLKKLGITTEMKILVINAPENYFELLGADISKQFALKNEVPQLVHLFAKDAAIFTKEMKAVLRLAARNTALITWASWYKKSSGISTDLSENLIRAFALHHNLVDVKVCAVSEVWSGLKLVVPLAKR